MSRSPAATTTREQTLAHDISRRTLLRAAATAGLAAGIGGILRLTPPLAAQEATPAAAAPARAHHMNVGQIDVTVLDDGPFAAPPTLMAANAPEQALAEALDEQGLMPSDTIPISHHPLLLETGSQRVLLDTGNGAFDPAAGKLMAALAAEGVAPEEVDVVLLTHLHFDHFGGALNAAGAPAFPNARYLIHAVEYEYWWAEPSLGELMLPADFKQLFRQGAKDVLTALQGTIEHIAPGDVIAPGVSIIDASGHTPGHLAVEIASDGDTALHIVDAAVVPTLHLQHPDWFLGSDNWPAWSLATRKALLDRAANEDLLVFSYHFPFPGVGRVTSDDLGWIWTPEE